MDMKGQNTHIHDDGCISDPLAYPVLSEKENEEYIIAYEDGNRDQRPACLIGLSLEKHDHDECKNQRYEQPAEPHGDLFAPHSSVTVQVLQDLGIGREF